MAQRAMQVISQSLSTGLTTRLRRPDCSRKLRNEPRSRKGGGVGEVTQIPPRRQRSEEHTSELQSRLHLVCRLLLEKKKKKYKKVNKKYRNELAVEDLIIT